MKITNLKRKVRFFKITQLLLLLLFIISLIAVAFTSITGGVINKLADGDFGTLEEPMSILLLGYDWTDVPRADSIMLVTVNPENSRGNIELNITSVPRDTEVYVTCAQTYEKINAGMSYAWDESLEHEENVKNGSTCMEETVEQLFDVDIDYYMSADFQGLVNMIEAVGGIEINVPYGFCEQNSASSGNVEDEVCLDPGLQTLNGEQALAYARTRKSINPAKGSSGDDQERNVKQQEVIMATAKKVMSNTSEYWDEALSVVNNYMVTDFPADMLVKAGGFATGLINRMQATLASGEDIMVYVKKPDQGETVYISPIEDVTGTSLNDTTTVSSEEFYGEETGFAQSTKVYSLAYSPLNTKSPTKNYDEEIKPVNFEFQMETLSTTGSETSSNLIASDATIAYFSTAINKTLETDLSTDSEYNYDNFVPYDPELDSSNYTVDEFGNEVYIGEEVYGDTNESYYY